MIEGQEGVGWQQWLALAQACERHGIGALFRSDHYLNLDGEHPERGSLDAWGTVCALAAVTDTVRLGVLVSPVTFRHPANLARLVASADEISGGRVELGLGAGWHEREHRAHGFPFPPLGERIEMLDEQLEIVTGSWGEGPFSFAGRHYRVNELDARPKPLQRPRPPILMGGAAGPRTAALAARWADEYNTAFASAEQVRERRAKIAAACERAGREPIAFSLMTGVLIGADERELRDRAGLLSERTGWPSVLEQPPAGWIIGTVEQAAEQLDILSQAGVSRVYCQQLLHEDLAHVEMLGRELAPALGGH
jgi:F420-dependent oxidoreductase-like protein